MMEHGKMSLPESLKMGLAFVKTYQKSPVFEQISKRLEADRNYQHNVIERLQGILQAISSLRR